MKVLDPVGVVPQEIASLAPRPATLRGCRVGILDNSKPNAAVLMGRLGELLAARAGTEPPIWWHKPGSSMPATVVDEVVARADVVLTGSAD